MPLVVLPGGLALLVGLLIVGIVILRADILPRWSAVLLVLGTLAMLGLNDQDARVLLAIPFGIAWMGVGYAPAGPVPSLTADLPDRLGNVADVAGSD